MPFFSYEFVRFFKTRIVVSMRVFVFLVSDILQNGAVPFFHSVFKTRVLFSMRVFVFLASGIL